MTTACNKRREGEREPEQPDTAATRRRLSDSPPFPSSRRSVAVLNSDKEESVVPRMLLFSLLLETDLTPALKREVHVAVDF